MSWFDEDITTEVALEFARECRLFTTETVVNRNPEIALHWPFSHGYPKLVKFEPKGAVIHVSESPSIWNALLMQAQGIYGSHFIVMNARHFPKDHYPLLQELPADVFAPFDINQAIPHSGFLSTCTWGIELRNVGRLRPVPIGKNTTPIMAIEENDDRRFKSTNEDANLFWRHNLWRSEFKGRVYRWEEFYYELPTNEQIETMFIILRVCDVLCGGMDPRFIVPSNCVCARHPIQPLFEWRRIREAAKNENKVVVRDWKDEVFPHAIDEKDDWDVDFQDEGTISDQLNPMRWRGEKDDGQLSQLERPRQFPKARAFRRAMSVIGYESEDYNFSAQLYGVAKGIGLAREDDIYMALKREAQRWGIWRAVKESGGFQLW